MNGKTAVIALVRHSWSGDVSVGGRSGEPGEGDAAIPVPGKAFCLTGMRGIYLVSAYRGIGEENLRKRGNGETEKRGRGAWARGRLGAWGKTWTQDTGRRMQIKLECRM